MTDKDRLDFAKGILQKRESLADTKKSISNELHSIRLNIREAIMEEDTEVNLKKELQKEIKQEGYRKHINGKIHELDATLNDVIMGTGDFNPQQLDFFDLPNVKKEYSEKEKEAKKKQAKNEEEK